MTIDLIDAASVGHAIADRIWTQHDASAIEQIFTDDVVYADVAWGYEMHGHDGVRTYLTKVLEGIPDFGEEVLDVLDVRPGVVVTRWHYFGTFSSPLITKRFDLPGTSVITLRDGRVSSNLDYYSADGFLAALDWVYPTTEALRDRAV